MNRRFSKMVFVAALLLSASMALIINAPTFAQDVGAKTKLAVLDLKAERGLDQGLVKLLNELLLTEFVKTGKYEVIGGSDLATMLKLEQQKRLMECTDQVCLSEIGGALGVDKLASANIGKVGDYFLVNVKIIDIRKAKVEHRVSHKVEGDEEELMSAITASVNELVAGVTPKPETGTSLPAPVLVEEERSWGVGILPITLWSAGGAGIITGIVFGALAKQHEDNANNPNFIGAQLEMDKAESDQLIANISYGVGAACAVAGFLVWLLSGDDSSDRTAVVPVATPGGLGVGLVFGF
jgi:hypothetical protein